ncbi:MAG TPA: GNAT family N-acetyltransferase [Anaerolineae bacterium]|nr:GNAT family N-acetyltransferase [Anaerolineae bacterium]
MRIELVGKLPGDLWQDFVDTHPESSIFHTPAMQAVFASSRGYEPLLRAAVSGDGRILALLTATGVRLAAGPLSRLTSRAIAYGGLLCEPGEEGREGLAALLRWQRKAGKHHHLFTEIRHRSDASSWRETLAECGYEHEQELNFLIDIGRPVADIWQGLGRTARKNVRRAERDGLTVLEATTPEDLQQIYALLQQVYAAAHVPLADASLFRVAFEQLVPQGAARFILARSPKGVAGARVVLLHKGIIFDWYAGADPEMRNSRPNDFLVWHTLAWGAGNGYHTFDFGGAGHPDVPYGVRDFKAKFGGQLVNYGRDRQVHSPGLLRMSEAGYNLLRRFL